MNGFLYSLLVGSFVGAIGTGLGSVFSFFIKSTGKKLPSGLMMFSGGIMVAVVILDLIPEAYRFGGINSTVFGMLSGALFVVMLSNIIPRQENPAGISGGMFAKVGYNPNLRVGILIGVGIAIHNFPEGLSIGSGLVSGSKFGINLAILIMLHDIPEGMAMAIPLRMGGVSKPAVLLYTVVSGLPTALGAFFGNLIGNISASFIGGCMAVAGGAMLYITVKELIPESLSLYDGAIARISIIGGLAAGALLVFFI